jgi:AraC-like DNA-binding protein
MNKGLLNFFNPRSSVLFVSILQGVVFAVLLLYRGLKRRSSSDYWLAALLVLLCLGNVSHFIGFAGVYDAYQGLSFFPFDNPFAIGAVIYLYVQTLTNSERKFTHRDFLLFTPALAFFTYHFLIFLQPLSFKNWFDDAVHVPYIMPVLTIATISSNAVFLYISIRHYRQYRSWLDANFSDTEKIKFNWLRNFLYLFAVLLLCSAIFDLTNSFIRHLSYRQYFWWHVIAALLTYYLAIAGYLRSESIRIEFTSADVLESPATQIAELPETVDRKALLKEDELKGWKEKLQHVMATRKPYLDPQLTLANLSRELAVNPNLLSFVINVGFEKNFNDFINDHRVAEVKAKLGSAASKNLTLLAVAFECGFNSKATFNRAFRKFTGLSPKEYQDQQIEPLIMENKAQITH